MSRNSSATEMRPEAVTTAPTGRSSVPGRVMAVPSPPWSVVAPGACCSPLATGPSSFSHLGPLLGLGQLRAGRVGGPEHRLERPGPAHPVARAPGPPRDDDEQRDQQVQRDRWCDEEHHRLQHGHGANLADQAGHHRPRHAGAGAWVGSSPVRAVVTGGAGFIGSNLVDALVADGAAVLVVDDLSHGSEANLMAAFERGATLTK